MAKNTFSPRDLTPYELDDVVTHVLGDGPEDVAGHLKQAADMFEWLDLLSELVGNFAGTGDTHKARKLTEIIRYLSQDHINYLSAVAEQMEAKTKAAMKGGEDE
ncbi:MAG: hypothetical protein ACK5JE_11735 [Castellaniella sp.]|uniref:hypothetical protein n=1 Tax=Castellaniella sp. TaxID=1955812 RepID=UPI003A8B342C